MDLILSKIQKAQERRKVFLQELGKGETHSFRAFGGRPEGIEGLTIDVFDRVAILNVYEDRCKLKGEELTAISLLLEKLYGTREAFIKHFIPDRTKVPTSGGESTSLNVLENGLRFEIHPNDGLSVGLFLDQRENRKRLAALAQGKRLLNLFSYTCGFSVHAAALKAVTVNVDVSKKYLEWGKRNFQLNNISLEGHKFVVEDTVTYLNRLVKRGEKFDVIVLDPPSFGRSEKGVFSVEKDFADCLEKAFQLLADGGFVLASSNFQKWERKDLESSVMSVARKLKRRLNVLDLVTPVDFELEENPLSAVLIQLKNSTN